MPLGELKLPGKKGDSKKGGQSKAERERGEEREGQIERGKGLQELERKRAKTMRKQAAG